MLGLAGGDEVELNKKRHGDGPFIHGDMDSASATAPAGNEAEPGATANFLNFFSDRRWAV